MTIRQKCEDQLVQHGLWPEEAKLVMDEVEKAKSADVMGGRWDDDISGYPPQLLAALWMSIKIEAIAWLTQNKPKHFALALLNA